MMISKCSSAFTYWDIHKQKYKGLWSTYSSTVVYKGEEKNMEPDSFFYQTLRVGYNNWREIFNVDNETNEIDTATIEGNLLTAFIGLYQLKVILLNNFKVWGRLDENTGKWDGTVGMVSGRNLFIRISALRSMTQVGYGKADVGVCGIAYTFGRSKLVDCTMGRRLGGEGWSTQFPQKKPAYENLLKVFDKYTWLGILVSLISVDMAILLISMMIKTLGFKQPDCVLVVLMPFSLLNAEGMPDWFIFCKKRVYSGSILLLTWALASLLVTMGFSCNLRAMLLFPSWDPFLDTSAQMAERDMTVVWESDFMVFYDKIKRSEDPDIIKLMTTARIVSNKEEVNDVIADKGLKNLVFYTPFLLPESYDFYESDEKIAQAYVGGWIIQKKSIWAEVINHFVGITYQAAFEEYLYTRYELKEPKYVQEETLEKLGLEHLAVAFLILGIGLGTSILGIMD
ncbi:uncharacterized protein LOC111715988 isoform X2 [Eurytemora carolleeae]|uniref:uncharacterized protein LOC111715988 isoform X2 n=1 Tax=Eurytemora carolleeae TaxID=1294199 RepID=UPI000C774D89|nr:uncharacterized protein LOC111715988 isoform X2 [Eurytemora carolleeae]|eukprot:XP_023347167.1 uncharacterized protein LOC111715988 isoform X2 [Eurytemora affinis]